MKPRNAVSIEEFRAMTAKKKRGKYRVAPVGRRTWRGRVYASMAEMEHAQRLHGDPTVRLVLEQVPLRLGVVENKFVPDFFVLHTDGRWEFVEVKGHETAKFRRDKKLWKAYGPGPLRIVRDGRTVEVIEPERAEGTDDERS